MSWLVAAKFGLAGAVGSLVGAWISQWIPGERLLALFGMFMLVAAGFMVKRPTEIVATARVTGWHVFALGAALGITSGLFGVGGGFLIVPALTLGLGLPIRMAVGTSLPIIAINSLAGFAGHVSAGEIDWRVTGLVAMGAIAGAWAAGRFSRQVPERAIRIGFAGFVSVVALYLVYRNASALMIVAMMPASLAALPMG